MKWAKMEAFHINLQIVYYYKIGKFSMILNGNVYLCKQIQYNEQVSGPMI